MELFLSLSLSDFYFTPPIRELLFTWMSSLCLFVLSFSHEMFWMRSGTELSTFLCVCVGGGGGGFLPTFTGKKLDRAPRGSCTSVRYRQSR